MSRTATWYKFPVRVFDFTNAYHRWLFSLCHFANDAQLFAHLWIVYPSIAEGQPPELSASERRSIFYHAMAHTYEALMLFFNPPEAIGPVVSREIRAVCASKRAVEKKDLRRLIARIQNEWQVEYKDRFEKVRNFIVAHYAHPGGMKRAAEDIEAYWQTFADLLQADQDETLADGTIIVEGSGDTGGRYRHTFVDALQEVYISRLFPPIFWGDGGEGRRVAEFLDGAAELMNELLVPLMVRVMQNAGIQLDQLEYVDDNWTAI